MSFKRFNIFSIKIAKYVMALFARDLLLMFVAVFCVILLIDLIELIKTSLGQQGVSNLTLMELAILKNYSTLSRVLPFVVLLATFKVYTILNHNFEIVGAYSLGMSNLHLITPALLVLILFTLFHAFILLPLGSYSMSKYQKFESEKLGRLSHTIYTEKTGIWLRQREIAKNDINCVNTNVIRNEQMIIHAAKINYKTRELMDVEIFVFDESGVFVKKITASKVSAINKTWIAYDAHITSAKRVVRDIPNMRLSFAISFTDLVNSLAPPEAVNIWKLHDFINIAQNLGFSVNAYYSYFWHTIFKPIFMFVMLIFGFTFTTSSNRGKRVGHVLAKLLVIGLLMYFGNELLIIAMLHKTKNYFVSIGLSYVFFLMMVIYMASYYKGSVR